MKNGDVIQVNKTKVFKDGIAERSGLEDGLV